MATSFNQGIKTSPNTNKVLEFDISQTRIWRDEEALFSFFFLFFAILFDSTNTNTYPNPKMRFFFFY